MAAQRSNSRDEFRARLEDATKSAVVAFAGISGAQSATAIAVAEGLHRTHAKVVGKVTETNGRFAEGRKYDANPIADAMTRRMNESFIGREVLVARDAWLVQP